MTHAERALLIIAAVASIMNLLVNGVGMFFILRVTIDALVGWIESER